MYGIVRIDTEIVSQSRRGIRLNISRGSEESCLVTTTKSKSSELYVLNFHNKHPLFHTTTSNCTPLCVTDIVKILVILHGTNVASKIKLRNHRRLKK